MKRVYWYRTLVYARQHFHDFTTIAIRRNVLNFCGADVEGLFRLRHSMNAKMLAAGNTMKQLWLILFMILGCANSTGSDNDNDQSTIILEALRERPGVSFVNKTRNYYTSIADSLLFETIFPGTEITCGYILRFYFYTNIYLSSNSNELFSMDGSKFVLANSSKDVIALTREVIKTIGGMSMGANELENFLEDHPDAGL